MAKEKSDFVYDPIVPFFFIREEKERMLYEIRRMKEKAGIHRIMLVFPVWNSKAKTVDSIGACEDFGQLLFEVKNELKEDGIEVGWWCSPTLSVGPQVDTGSTPEYDFQKVVGIDGSTSATAKCPLDKKFQRFFQKYMQAVIKKAKPEMILIEDDYEISNQGVVQYGCFCPLHIKKFCEKTGEDLSREELEIIFRNCDEKAAKYRRIWAELSRESLVELAEKLREAVDEITPDTRIGCCQPGPCDFDGDITEGVAKAFAGETRPLVRLWGSDYYSDRANNFSELTFHSLYSKKTLPENFELIYEADPYPHSRFYFSANKLKSLMTLSMIYGLEGALFYTTQYTDTPLEDVGYIDMMKNSRMFFSQLRKSVNDYNMLGVSILYKPHAHTHRKIVGSKGPYYGYPGWVSVLGRFGIPYTVNENNDVFMICGEDVLELSDNEIKEIFSRGVFLDGLAAKYLCQRGYGHLIGLSVKEMGQDYVKKIGHEFLKNNKYLQRKIDGKYIYFTNLASAVQDTDVFLIKKDKNAETVSEFVDEDGNHVSPACALYENELGGRTAVIAYDIQKNTLASILNYKRKEQFRTIIEWLGRKSLPVFVEEAPNVFVTALENSDTGDRILAIFNLCTDDIEQTSLIIDEQFDINRIKYLDDKGTWMVLNDVKFIENDYGYKKLLINKTCQILRPLLLKLEK